jgi:hypothetical protein
VNVSPRRPPEREVGGSPSYLYRYTKPVSLRSLFLNLDNAKNLCNGKRVPVPGTGTHLPCKDSLHSVNRTNSTGTLLEYCVNVSPRRPPQREVGGSPSYLYRYTKPVSLRSLFLNLDNAKNLCNGKRVPVPGTGTHLPCKDSLHSVNRTNSTGTLLEYCVNVSPR